MKEDILRYKKEFTLYEIALIWADVEVETTENRENVRSALRILLRALENLKLLSDWRIKQSDLDPKDLRDETGDYNFNGPWTRCLVTPQDLKEMFHRLGDPLPAWLIKLFPEGSNEKSAQEGELAPSSPDSQKESSDSSSKRKGRFSQEALVRLIRGLIILMVKQSNNLKYYLINDKINTSTIMKEVHEVLQDDDLLRGLGQSQFYEILTEVTTDKFYEKLGNALKGKK